MQKSNVIVVGGGLIGLLIARELSQQGWRCLLVDKGTIGSESSWAGGGILSPLYPWRYPDPVTELAHWSQAQYPRLAEQLLDDLGIDPEWTLNGLLMLDSSDQSEAFAWAQHFGYRLESIGAEAMHDLEPGLHTDAAEGLWMGDIAQIRNPRLLKALRSSLEAAGVTFIEGCRVSSLRIQGGRITGVHSDKGDFSAGQVVVTAGAWSGELLATLGFGLPVQPVRGQMLLFRARPGVAHRIVLGDGHYMIPRQDGRVLVGSTMEHVGFDKGVTAEARAELEQVAYRYFPALREFPVERHWAGLRPSSPTGVPFIGQYPNIKGLFINTGHFRNGVVMAPASARLLADLMLGRPPILDPRPYALQGGRIDFV